jgi:hypothetical protein
MDIIHIHKNLSTIHGYLSGCIHGSPYNANAGGDNNNNNSANTNAGGDNNNNDSANANAAIICVIEYHVVVIPCNYIAGEYSIVSISRSVFERISTSTSSVRLLLTSSGYHSLPLTTIGLYTPPEYRMLL